jgi:Zn-dependent membrane protease YugP
MKKLCILVILALVMSIGAVFADDYWDCVNDSGKTGAKAAKEIRDEYGITTQNSNVDAAAGYVGGATAGLIYCD